MARIIVNADDLGIHPDTDRGIAEGFTRGVVSSATALMTTPFTERAIREVAVGARLPVGVHLSLTLGWPVTPPARVPALVDDSGAFRLTARELLRHKGDAAFWQQVETELGAQVQRMLDLGVRPTHLDSHQHIHLHPTVFAVVRDLQRRFTISHLRMVREPIWPATALHRPLAGLARANPLKWLFARWSLRRCGDGAPSADRFFGLLHSGTFDEALLLRLLNARDDGRTWEIACHPGYPAPLDGGPIYPQPGVDAFIRSPERRRELGAVTSPAVIAAAADGRHRIVSFADIADTVREPA